MKVTRYSKYTILLLCIFAFTSFAQIVSSSTKIDSINSSLKNEYKLKLNNSQQFLFPQLINNEAEIFNQYSLFVFPQIDQSSVKDNLSMLQLRNEINQSMNVYRQGQNKYQLGFVGDILGYVSTAAAAGLAVYHVQKYKKYYGLK